eukprot:gene8256-5776_t
MNEINKDPATNHATTRTNCCDQKGNCSSSTKLSTPNAPNQTLNNETLITLKHLLCSKEVQSSIERGQGEPFKTLKTFQLNCTNAIATVTTISLAEFTSRDKSYLMKKPLHTESITAKEKPSLGAFQEAVRSEGKEGQEFYIRTSAVYTFNEFFDVRFEATPPPLPLTY